MDNSRGEVFTLRADEWKLRFDGVVASPTWRSRNGAVIQLALLHSGYSALSASGTITHPGAACVTVVSTKRRAAVQQ